MTFPLLSTGEHQHSLAPRVLLVPCWMCDVFGFDENPRNRTLSEGATSLLEVSIRSPNADEQRYIDRQCHPDFALLEFLVLMFGIFPGLAFRFVGGWLGGFISTDAANWARYAGWLIGLIGPVCSIICYWPRERKRRQQAEADSAGTSVEELVVKSSRVVELLCFGSHEPCLVFDVGDNQLLYLRGQWIRWEATYSAPAIVDDGNGIYLNLLDPPFSFPSDSFVVTRLPNSGHVFGIKITGDYLQPGDPIAGLKPAFDFNDCDTIAGTIRDVPQSLQAEHDRRSGT